jgi:serine/threonine protein kinase
MASPTQPTAPTTGPVTGECPREASPGSVTRLEDRLPVAAPPPVSRTFGEYELLTEIARGGMGVVYKARQIRLNRVVALKMILSGRLADEDDVRRFRTEAEAAARLQHDNIVAVHDVGEVDGQHYFSMEFIDGRTLAQRLAAGPLPSRDAARYVRQIARAVHFAHRQGVLHRDLKPSNILVDGQDEPHVTDFGLAKRTSGDASGKTRSGAVLGTPSYMAPEQAGGRIKDQGPWTDVYGLGAVLYELLTGRAPFKAETPLDTLMQVLENDPVPPRLLNSKIDNDLETICLKCLEKDPRRRYPTAEALAEDLQRYLNGDAVQARSANVLDYLTRTLTRSQHDVAFHTWSTMLLVIAAIVFVKHVGVFLLIETQQLPGLVTSAPIGQFVVIGLVFWYNRGRRLLPTSAAERELWTIWIGYMIAHALSWLTIRGFDEEGIIKQGVAGGEHWRHLILYPFSAVLSGMAFFIMGSNYWGRCYAVGCGFFVLAALMPLRLEWAPLIFGLSWSGTLLGLGLHLRELGNKAGENKPHE